MRSTIETGGLPGFKFWPHVGKVEILGPTNGKIATDSPQPLQDLRVQAG